MRCRLRQPLLQGVDKNKNLPTKSCVTIIARTVLKSNRKQVGFLPAERLFFGQNVEKTPKPRRRSNFAKKFANKGLTRLTDCGILFSQRWLANSNHVAPEKRSVCKRSAPFLHSFLFSTGSGSTVCSAASGAAPAVFGTTADAKKTKTGHSA